MTKVESMIGLNMKERMGGKDVGKNRAPVHGVAMMACVADKVGWEVAVMERLEGSAVIIVLKHQKVRDHPSDFKAIEKIRKTFIKLVETL